MHSRRGFLNRLIAVTTPLLGVVHGEDYRDLLKRALEHKPFEAPEGDPLRIAIVVGHNDKARGARGMSPLKGFEWDFWARQSGALQEAFTKFGCESKIYFRQKGSSYRAETERCYLTATNELQPHCIIELHYNDAGRKAPKGTITLHAGSVKAGVLATACQSAMERVLSQSGEDRRGLAWSKVECRKSGRGYAALTASSVPTAILEPAFSASNPEEAELLKVFGEEMCWAVAKNVAEVKLPLIG